MFNRGFGGGFGGFGGGGGGFGNQFGGNRFQSGFVGGPGNSGLMGMNRGGFRGGFGGNRGGFVQQQRTGLFGRGRGSFTPRGGSRGVSKYTPNNQRDAGKKDIKDEKANENKQKEIKTERNETNIAEGEKNGQSQKDAVQLKPRPASMDFGGPVGKKGEEKKTVGDLEVDAKPPWETKKKSENKQDQKTDKFGAPWEKKKNDDLAEKANNAPWELKKAEQNKQTPPWTKNKEPKEMPPWKQKEEQSEEVIDLSSPTRPEEEDKSIGPPPWLQQGQKNSATPFQQPPQQQQKPQQQPPKPIKKEPLFDSRKRSFESSHQSHPSGPGPVVKSEPQIFKEVQPSSQVALDTFNSDLNLVINNDGYSGETLNKPMGFCFCWGGARATYGVTRGKICFEVKVTRNLPVDFGDDHKEEFPHVIRVGWSVDSHGFQLGEDQDSFGFGGTGKFSANCRFSNYGQTYGVGDVVMALLDLEAKPPNISFAKNGRWFGVAHRLGSWPVGAKEKALFPHVLSKNCAFEVNFGQRSPWFKPPPDFVFINNVPLHQRVRGMMPPEKVSDCEIIMIVGLPGVGKTTWGLNMQKDHPDKRFNIIGTDTLIDKMKVNGLPRKNNYHGRWEVLIKKATECLNKLFQIGSKRSRNYILDQTNVYATARKRKMRNFDGFRRICAVLVTPDAELERRAYQRTYVDGKFVPDEAVLEMKANFSLPHESEPHIDRLIWVELSREQARPLIDQYNIEGQKNRPPRSKAFPQDNRSQSQDRRDRRDSDNRMGHQRSFSDRGPQGDRGRSREKNQERDRAPQRDGAFDRNQSGFNGGPGDRGQGFKGGPVNREQGFQGGPGDRDQGFKGGPGSRDQGFPARIGGRRNSDINNRRTDVGDDNRQGHSWQKQPGNRQEWAHGGRDESPAARREDIPFKKPKVEPLDTGYRNDRDERNPSWAPQVKEERMDVGYEQARFGGGGNRFLGDKDVDYRMSGDGGRPGAGNVGSPYDRDERNQGPNRFGNQNEVRVKEEGGFPGNQFGPNRGDNRPNQDGRFPRDQRNFGGPDRFQPEGPNDPFRPTGDGPYSQAQIKVENPFLKSGDNPFLARLAEFDKERPLRFDQYVKNTPRSDDDMSKGFGAFRRGGNFGGASGRSGQEGRGDKRFGADNRFNTDNRFGGSNRKESFLARGPGGFNRDRQEVPRDDRSGRSGFDRDLKRKGEDEARYNKGPDDRDKFHDRSFDDRDSYLDPMEYNRRRDLAYYDVHRDHYSEYDRGGRRQDDRRDHDKKPESRDSRGNVPGDEWSGGGDAGEWQGGGGEMPAHMKKWTDPQESGDGTRGAKKDSGPAAVDRDQRWDTDNRQKNWNQPQQQQYGRSEGGTAKDVDYRQQLSAPPDSRDNRGVKDQRVEAENYNTSGWTEGQQDKQRQTVPYGQVQPKSEQYQQGEWSDPAKSSWQGGGNGSEEKRWEQQAAREEWSGGWASNEHQSAESAQRSDDKSQWSSEKYGTGYQEQGQQQQQQYPAYSTGYEGQRDQQYDSYSAGNQTAEKDQHGYAQQTHDQSSSQDWSQYSQQGWEGYGQGTGYGEWNQTQAVTTDSTESKASKTGNSASSQSQYSSWSEYKAAGSATTTEASNSAAAPQSGTNQYGHYSQTSTTANSAKDTQQAWESRNYGYDTQAQPTSANAYSHSTHGSSTANATPQINPASLLGAAANISLPPNLDLNAIQQSLAAHGFTQPPPPPPGPAPAPAAVLFPAVAAYQAGSGLAGIAPGLPHGAGMYPAVRRQ